MTSTALLDEIRQLSPTDRMQLLEEIWMSIADEGKLPITEAQKRELDRRLANMEGNPEKGLTWREVVSDVEGD